MINNPILRGKSNITVLIEVFNEESRIETCLKNLSWVDEIIIFDKGSTDRTVEISKKYAKEVINVPYSDASENFINNISKRETCEWVFFPTPSSLIHPELSDDIVKLTSNKNFEYDVIGIPYAFYSFGISSKNSPWGTSRKYTLIRKSTLNISCELHNEISSSSNKIYDMPLLDREKVLYHCTHRDSDDFFSKVHRYTKYEAKYNDGKQLKIAFYDILKSIVYVLFRKKSFLLGWDGIALSLAYTNYFITKFIYIWDGQRKNGNDVYPVIETKIEKLWQKRNQ